MAFLLKIAQILIGLFGLFRKSPEEKLGELEVTDNVQKETIHALQVDKAVSDRIDSMPDAERVQLANAINARKP